MRLMKSLLLILLNALLAAYSGGPVNTPTVTLTPPLPTETPPPTPTPDPAARTDHLHRSGTGLALPVWGRQLARHVE